jgi:hypothetical protein
MELWSSRDDVEWLVIDMSSQPGANMSDAEIDRIIDVLDWYRRQ